MTTEVRFVDGLEFRADVEGSEFRIVDDGVIGFSRFVGAGRGIPMNDERWVSSQ